MQLKRFYLFLTFYIFLLELKAQDQKLPDDTRLYRIEIEFKEILFAGDLDRAIKILNSYKMLTTAPQPRFDNYIVKVENLKTCLNTGNALFRKNSFQEAYSKFVQCKNIFGSTRIPFVENKIEVCTRKITESLVSGKLDKKIEEQAKIIIAQGNIFKGDDMLHEGDFNGALKAYSTAININSNDFDANNRAIEKMKGVENIILINEEYAVEKDQKKRLTILLKYRSTKPFIIIKSIENEIELLETMIKKQSDISYVDKSLMELSKECNIKALIAFSKNIPTPQKFDIDKFRLSLIELNRKIEEINDIEKTGDPSQRIEFAMGGYLLLLQKKDLVNIPEVDINLRNCIRAQYFQLLHNQANSIIRLNQDFVNAREYIIKSIGQATTEEEKIISKEFISKINKEFIGCDKVLKEVQILRSKADLDIKEGRKEEAFIKNELVKIVSLGCPISDGTHSPPKPTGQGEPIIVKPPKVRKVLIQLKSIEIYSGLILATPFLFENKVRISTRTAFNYEFGINWTKMNFIPERENSKKWLKDKSIGLGYFKYVFSTVDANLKDAELFNIDYLKLNVGLKFHKPTQKARIYVKIEPFLLLPLKTNYTNYYNKTNYDSNLISLVKNLYDKQKSSTIENISGGLSIGLGIFEKHWEKIGFGIEPYGSVVYGFLNSKTKIEKISSPEKLYPIFLSSGIRVNIRFGNF